MLDAMRQGLCAVDREGRVTFVNRAACALLGVTPAQVLGQGVQRFLVAPPAPGEEAARARRLSGSFGQRQTLKLTRADGAPLTVAYVVDPLVEGGERVGALVSFEDVTERERTEGQLREAQRTLSTLMANLPGIAYRCQNNRDWTMEFMSEGTLALTGYPPERFLGPGGLSFNTIIHPEDQADTWERVQAALARRAPFQLTYRLRCRDGSERWVWEQGRGVWSADGRLLALEGFITDITERKQIEARLVASDRMASVGMLAAGVAHEINNPLAYVQANVGFVSDVLAREGRALAPALVEEAQQALQEAREGTQRMRDIVRDLRTFSRVDDAVLAPVDLERVLDSASSIASNEVRHRARLVRVRGGVPQVLAHEGRLVQLFVNLIVNAAHALPEGQVERHEIRLRTAAAPTGEALVEVQDTGSGIAPELLPRLFEPFFTTKPAGRGTGLGLSICQGIVAALGGSIEVQSAVGQGSTFRVRLPAAPAASTAEPAPPSPASAPARRGRILIIDDEALVGAALRRTLARAHEVHVTTRADEALARLASGEHFDLILCDLMMPHMSGMDFHAALAERFPVLLPRVVFLTGGGFTPRARAFLEAVPNAKLDKPFDPEALQALVQARLQGA
nr:MULTISPECIES: PAS domain S-box protein [Myxococcaceae]